MFGYFLSVISFTKFKLMNPKTFIVLQEILSYYEILRSEFRAAAIYASTFEDYIENILPIKDQLPVITQEIGDTWIQGISSDPYKLAFQRAFQTGLQLCYDSSRFISKLEGVVVIVIVV